MSLSQTISSKRTGLWMLYDFANSLAFSNVSFYFTLWLVSDNGIPDIWISIPAALSTLILLITIPFLGAFSDRTGKRIPFLATLSLLSISCLITLGFLALYAHTTVMFALIIVLYFLFLYFFQGALVFYDSILHSLVRTKSKEQISGFGLAMGQLGNALGILLVLPFVHGSLTFFGYSGRPVSFILGGILFLIFSTPVFLFLKDVRVEKSQEKIPEHVLTKTLNTLKAIYNNRPIFRFLVVYYLFSDALLTLQLFVTLYLQIVGGFGDGIKTLLGGIGLFCAITGALTSGIIARKIGSTRGAILVAIAVWAVCLTTLAFAHSVATFVIVVILNGFVFGVLYSLSRAYYSDLAPRDKQAEFFSIYSLFEKFASVLGPLVWSSVVLLFAFSGEVWKYRFAMLSLALIVSISFVIFYRGRNEGGAMIVATE